MSYPSIRTIAPRTYLLFFAVAFTAVALLLGTSQSFSAGALKVLSPNGGQSFKVGQSVKIKWAKGNGGAKVRIVLLKGGKGYLAITKKTANDGTFTWKVPAKAKAGGNYRIKVQSLSNTKVTDTSNKTFKITQAKVAQKATLKVTKPNGGQKYKTGQKIAIRWAKGNGGTHVKILLLKGGKAHKVIAKKTANDGKYTYTIPAVIKTGKTYKIKISSSKNAKITDTSNKNFTITKAKTSSTIKVISPNGGEKLKQGSSHTIKWAKGNGGAFVKIQLTRVIKGKDKPFRFIARKTKNDGAFIWKVPATKAYPVGTTYKVKVIAFKGGAKINDLSNKTFSIVKAASTGGSTGGGTGGGKGGGKGDDNCHDGTDCDDDNAGGDEGIGGDGENKEPSTIRITSLTEGQEFETGVTFDIAWTATGAAAGNDVCIAISNTNNGQFHGKYDGQFRKKVSKGKVTAKFVNLPIGSYKVRLSVRKKGQELPPCGPTGSVGDDVVIQHVAPAPVAICGNGIVEGSEVCDYAGVMCQGPGTRSRLFCSWASAVVTCAYVYEPATRWNDWQGNVVRCENCVAQKAIVDNVTYYNRNDIPDEIGRAPIHEDLPNNRICPGFVP